MECFAFCSPMLMALQFLPFCAAACHQRFDSFGLAYEGYGPIGDVCTGLPVDTADEGFRVWVRTGRPRDSWWQHPHLCGGLEFSTFRELPGLLTGAGVVS